MTSVTLYCLTIIKILTAVVIKMQDILIIFLFSEQNQSYSIKGFA